MSVEAFTTFYRRYNRLVHSVAQQRLEGLSDAEDITAEVFRIAWRHSMDGEPLTLPWLYQVLRNVIGNEYRRLSRSDYLIDRVGSSLWGNVLSTATEDAVDLRRCIRDLPEQDRELIYMAYWEDLTRAEIAQILGCSPVAVRVRLRRARQKLETRLASGSGTLDCEEANDGRA